MLKLSDVTDWKQLINQVTWGDCLEGMKLIPDKSIDLILTDPPYFEVKGDFDFQFEGFEGFLAMVEVCAKEFKRILKDKGSIYWFGHAKRIAYIQVVFDRYFTLENSLVWHVPDRQTKKGVLGFRCYAPVTERILFYSNECVSTNGISTFPCREYLREEIQRAKGGISFKEVNQALGTADNGGGVASAVLSLDKAEPVMITHEHYLRLQKWLGEGYLRREYEDLRREFNNETKLEDVLRFNQDAHETVKTTHPTAKPQKLIQAMLQVSSRSKDLVLDPFMGSWTTARACKDLGRAFIGFELEEAYCKVGEERLRQGNLF